MKGWKGVDSKVQQGSWCSIPRSRNEDTVEQPLSLVSSSTYILIEHKSNPNEKGPEPSKQQKVLIEQKKKVLEREREKKKFMKKKIEVSGWKQALFFIS